MNCPNCTKQNDQDALYCSECGKPLPAQPEIEPAKTRKPYRFIFLLIPVVVIVAGFGYYKYFLPDGVSAVVNGEEIKQPELDAAVSLAGAAYGMNFEANRSGQQAQKFRYQVLNKLIREKLVLQEARKAGVDVSPEDVSAAAARVQQSSGMEKDIFNKAALQRYGSLPAFQEAIRRELLIEKFISEKIAPHGIERQAARGAVDRWMEKLYAKSAVRITLSEQWSAASCACCSNRADAAPLSGADSRGNGVSGKGGSPSPAMSAAGKASEAALLYWHEKHGNEEVSTEVKDYGCHMQIDIIKNNKTVGSLQYQGGRISELR